MVSKLWWKLKYYISDTHFGHTNIIKLAKRPYESVEHMDEDMIAKWNSRVGPGDLVYHLGDFAWRNVKQYRDRLNGQIILIKGNHDRRLTKQQENYLFITVYDYKKIRDGANTLILFHYPIWSWDGSCQGSIHFHGHIHNNSIDRREKEGSGIRINVSVERMNYEPKTFEEIINAKTNELSTL